MAHDSDARTDGLPVCRRCSLPVEASAWDYDVFEQMHYVCFHYEFEHQGDPDIECSAGGCPAAGIRVRSRYVRTDGVDLMPAANTVVPAILALEANGFTVTQEANLIVARAGNTRFAAEDPVAVLGLVKLAETRRPWRADDAEIDDVMGPLQPVTEEPLIGRVGRQTSLRRGTDCGMSAHPIKT